MSSRQNKNYVVLFLVAVFSFIFCACTEHFRQQFADDIIWIPKHEYTLFTETGIAPVLSEKVPVILNIKFDNKWNNDKVNKPKPAHRYEKWEVNPEMITFRIKSIRVEGGQGELFKRLEIEGNHSIGAPFKVGSIVQHGHTHLYYVPDSKDTCHTHKISIDAIILTCDFNREGGDPITCSLRLDEPPYALKVRTDVEVFYVEDKSGTPIHIDISSENPLASKQNYRLVKWCVTDRQGTMYIDTGSCRKPICSNEPLKFGSNTFFYAPKPGTYGTHTIHLTVGNTKSDITQDYSFSVKVQDHRIENFTAELSLVSEETPLLPFKDRVCKLNISALTDSGKVLSYQVKAIKMNGGKFILRNAQVIESTPLTVGVNTLMFNPCGFIGDLEPSITIVNDKGDEREVTFKQPFVIQDPDFKLVSSLKGSMEHGMDNRYINLNIIAPFNTTSDKFILSNYRLSGGISGNLLKLTGDPIEPGGMLSVGDSAFRFKLGDLDAFMDKIDGAPKLYFDITYPDRSNHETEAVDLSIFLFEALASKIDSLNNDGKELYKTLVDDYSMPSVPALQTLKEIEPVWCSRHSNLHDILIYMQHGTAVSTQVVDELANLQTLKRDTKNRINKRVLTTQFLNRWYDEMNSIHSSQDPKECSIRTDILNREVNSFSDLFQACRNIPGIEDVAQSLEDVLTKIEVLKRGIQEKQADKDRKKAEYQSFQRETRCAIKNECKTREADVERLEEEIEELCQSRDKLESKIRKHDGDISTLNSLMQDLSRVNSELGSKCSSLEAEMNSKQEETDLLFAKTFNREQKKDYLSYQRECIKAMPHYRPV